MFVQFLTATDLMPNFFAMADHMRAEPCCETLINASFGFREIREEILHSDLGSQYTSAAYRAVIYKYGIVLSMNTVPKEDTMTMTDAKASGQE